MDFKQAAAFFDRQDFDAYNVITGVWNIAAFKGQIKVADDFISMWNRATRKRVMTCAPETESAVLSVVRVTGTNDVYMVGTVQRDHHQNVHYRNTYNIQHVQGAAIVRRRSPVGPANNPGWAVNTVIANTFADFELRSANEEQDSKIYNYGSFFLFMPAATDLRRLDTVEVGNRRFYIMESYPDSGYVGARSTIKEDDRIDVTYVRLGAAVYNTANGSTSYPETSYNVTARILPVEREDISNTLVTTNRIRVLIPKLWIGITPKINDVINFGGLKYRVKSLSQDSLALEWHIEAET